MADFLAPSDKGPVSKSVRYWLGEIAAARKREKDWRKEGRRVNEIYGGEKKDQTPFNILYSNTETLLPALYNSVPRPVVQRRFKDEDPLGKASATAGQRVSEFLLDTNSEEYASFDDVMVDAVLDGLLPGRGASRVKYDAQVGKAGDTQVLTYETVCYESLKWDRWIFGFAKKWKRVPWVTFEHDVTKQEAEELFTAAVAEKLTYAPLEEIDREEDSQHTRDDETDEQRKVARVYEIWDKEGGKRVLFIAPTYPEGALKVEDDPLELTGFYPMPEPLRFLRKSNDQMPVALYMLYENQAKELNRISTRINKIIEALKVRGVYDGTLEEIEDVLKKDDNTLVPAKNVASLQNMSGLDKAIWLMPIEKLITVVQQLFIAREQCKQVIYEITGISDILRGASRASETLGAQEIKQQWATLRLKRAQREVQRYARDLIRITLEIAAKRFRPETFAAMTGLPFPTAQDKQSAQSQIMLAQASQQPPPPEAVAAMQQPDWDAVLGMLQNDTQRQYKIDIETNSTVDLEATEDQKHIAEVMNAIAQFLNGVAPLVENGSMPFEAAQAMLLGVVRRYRFGTEIEDQIKKMQPPKPQDDGGKAALEAEKAKMDIERAAMQKEGAALKRENQLAVREMQLENAEERFRLEQEFAKGQTKQLVNELDLKLQKATNDLETKTTRQNMQTEGKVRGMVDRVALNEKVNAAPAKQVQTAVQTAVQGLTQQLQTMQEMLLKALLQQGEVLQQVAQLVSAEKELVRGPDGRATGVRLKNMSNV